MKKSLVLTVVVLSLISCASTDTNTFKFAGIGAGVGCVAGGVLASLTGGKPGVGCAIGAAGGALIGYAKAREAELTAMRDAQAAFSGSKVETQTVAVTDKATGEERKIEAFRSLAVPLSARALTDDQGQKVFFNLGRLAKKHDAVVTVTGGTTAERKQAVYLIKASGALNVHADPTVRASIGRKNDLIVIVAPANKSKFIEV